MIISTPALGLLILAAGGAAAATASSGGVVDLRVSRVAVFSSGVAYFECEATVEGNATAELTFRTQQINDIIKSMIVSDADGGRISAVSYPSQEPVERALRSFGVDLTGKPSFSQLLDQLRGEPVEISGARDLKGRILGVEKRREQITGGTIERDVLNLYTLAGVMQVVVSEITGLNFADNRINEELGKALSTLALSHDADKKSVSIDFQGQGRRRVRVAYLLEAPIWKTSYRLALREGEKPFMQGWAMVENATEEDWDGVRLSLVSGRPISFTMDLYSPLYVPRPQEELELYASLRPPTYEADMGKPAENKMATRAARGVAPAAAPGMPAAIGGRYLESGVSGQSTFQDMNSDESELNAVRAGAGVESVAVAADAGELFQYAIAAPVSISRQHSAMLPIVNEAVEARKVSIYNESTHPRHPLNGLRLVNTSGKHLMQGPVTVFDGDVYAGEAKLPDLKPSEERLVAYALDLGIEVAPRAKPAPSTIMGLKIVKGVLHHTTRLVQARTYELKNKDAKEKTVLIEQAYGDQWKLIEPSEPTERTASLSRFKVDVPAGKTVSQNVVLEQVIESSFAINDASNEQFAVYLRDWPMSTPLRAAIEKLMQLRAQLTDARRTREELETAAKNAVSEQARVRENLKTLERNTDTYQRQLRKFDDLETQIEQAGARTVAARAQEEQRRAELERYIQNLDVQ